MRSHHRHGRSAEVALLALLALLAAACARGDDDGEATAGGPTTAAGSGATVGGAEVEANRLDRGGFGDLETVCRDGDASGATDIGVTDDTIQVGTVTDKGFTARPGVNQEMYDAAVAFAAWCNEHGGINGRELVIADRDAAVVDYNAQVVEACSQDFALVGGGAALDDADNGGRVACGLPNIAAFVVSQTVRAYGVEELQVQPLPFPPDEVNGGIYRRLAEVSPELIDAYGVMTSQFGSVLALRDEAVAAARAAGFQVVYDEEYSAVGESNWRPFVEGMRSAGVEVYEFIGDPVFMAQILEAMDAVGWRPARIILQPNLYDETFAELVAPIASDITVRLQYVPMELAEENPATADYVELIERYRPGGITALLGMQSVSAFLLFAQAATACGSELTRQCLIDEAASVTEWTGGGLHAPQDLATGSVSPCVVLLALTPDGFVVDEELTAPTDGIYNCDPDNVVVTG